MKIVGISGSLRENSHTLHTVRMALNLAKTKGFETELIDLQKWDLPFCNGSRHYPDHPDVERLQQAVMSAKGIIIGTPEYHGSLSGSLKNCLDLLDASHLAYKVVAIISILGGGVSQGSVSATSHICRYLNAWILPKDLIIHNSHTAFDAKGEFINPMLRERLEELVHLLLSSIQKLE